MTKRLAGIDIGTLTCRLLIADLPDNTCLNELCSERRILRLGEGVDQSKRLRHEAADRVIQCLKEWRATIESYRVDAQVVVATSAVRDAANRQEFLNRVRSEAGFEVEILSGDEEARRTMLGIRSGLPGDIKDVLALDIGGGSTEFIVAQHGQPPVVQGPSSTMPVVVVSWLPLIVVRLKSIAVITPLVKIGVPSRRTNKEPRNG